MWITLKREPVKKVQTTEIMVGWAVKPFRWVGLAIINLLLGSWHVVDIFPILLRPH